MRLLDPAIAILKINGEALLQIQDDGQFLKYVVHFTPRPFTDPHLA